MGVLFNRDQTGLTKSGAPMSLNELAILLSAMGGGGGGISGMMKGLYAKKAMKNRANAREAKTKSALEALGTLASGMQQGPPQGQAPMQMTGASPRGFSLNAAPPPNTGNKFSLMPSMINSNFSMMNPKMGAPGAGAMGGPMGAPGAGAMGGAPTPPTGGQPKQQPKMDPVASFYQRTPQKLKAVEEMLASDDQELREVAGAWIKASISGPDPKDYLMAVGGKYIYNVLTNEWISPPTTPKTEVMHLDAGPNIVEFTDENGNVTRELVNVDEPGEYQLEKITTGSKNGVETRVWGIINKKTGTGRIVTDENTGKPLAAPGNVSATTEITSSAKTEIFKKMTDAGENLARMEYMKELIPDILSASTIPGRVALKIQEWGAFWGIEPSDKYYTQKEAITVARDVSNRYIKFITGAQMSEREASRLLQAIPNPKDDPAGFQAKFNAALKVSRITYEYWKKLFDQYMSQGMDPNSAAEKARDDSEEFVRDEVDKFVNAENEGML